LKTLQDDSDRRARLREQAESSYKEVVSTSKQLESELGIEGRALQKVEEVKRFSSGYAAFRTENTLLHVGLAQIMGQLIAVK
jgi:hypothetical protein